MIGAVGNLVPGIIRFDIAQATQAQANRAPIAVNDAPSLPQNGQQILPPVSSFESNLASSGGFPFQLSAAEFSEVFGTLESASSFFSLLPGTATLAYSQSSLLTASRVSLSA